MGRDVLVRIAFGTRVSLLVGVAATVIATGSGVLIGLTAGYFGGRVDALLARCLDIVLSFPYVVLRSRSSPSTGQVCRWRCSSSASSAARLWGG